MNGKLKITVQYTLIELLVVLAVIVTLTSLLLAALQTGKRKISETQCLDNLKQITTANILLDGDEHRFPDQPQNDVQFDLYPYLGITRIVGQKVGEEIFACPEDNGSWSYGGVPANNTPPKTTFEAEGISYWWNKKARCKAESDGTYKDGQHKFLRAIFQPSTYIILTGPGARGTYAKSDPQTHFWHEPGVPRWPIGFGDGHAAFVIDVFALDDQPLKTGHFHEEYDFHNYRGNPDAPSGFR